MNIFYYSVHHILEDDEVRLWKSLGHNVFCLGHNSPRGASQGYRPAIKFNDTEHYLYEIYDRSGGDYFKSSAPTNIFPAGFDHHFSLIVVMHSSDFIIGNWAKISSRPVVWRTIGQAIEEQEKILAPFRKDGGLRIVRYTPVELEVPHTVGEDVIIRFYKNPATYCNWTGEEVRILTFSNELGYRFPLEAAAYREISAEIPCALGGVGNGSFDVNLGFVPFTQQLEFYRNYRAYLYVAGLDIPYTLNFIEAWMTGMPVVVYAPRDRVGPYFEIDRLIKDGVTGFICRDIDSAKSRCRQLLVDIDLARRIGCAGRQAAIDIFGIEHIAAQWRGFLRQFEP